MEQKSSDRFAIYPIVSLGNGDYSISDETLVAIFEKIVEEKKLEQLFYDGSIRDIQGWLNFIKRRDVFPIIVWDVKAKKIVHIAWLKDVFDCCAWFHHCAIGPYQRGVWEASLEHWRKICNLKLLLGLTPKTNLKAVKILKKIGKFN